MKRTMLVIAVLVMAAMIAAPAMAQQLYETFDSYSDGALVGQGDWMGVGGLPVVVEDGSAKLTYDNTYKGQLASVSGLNITGDMIYFSCDVYGGIGSNNNAFDIRINDAAGINFARWYGGIQTWRGRIGDQGVNYITGQQNLNMSDWDHLAITLDTVNQIAKFYWNGTQVTTDYFETDIGTGGFSYAVQSGIGSSVDSVKIGLQNYLDTANGDYVYVDNIYVGTTENPVVPEPSSFMALGMFGLGALGFIKRRRA